MPKPLTMWIMTNCRKFLKRWEYQTILSVSWEICVQVKKQQLEPCMEQLFGSRSRKEYDRAICCHPVSLTYTLSTWWERPGWMSYKLEWDRWEKHQEPQIWGWYHSNGRMWRGTKSCLMRVKKESEWAGLRLNIKKTKIMASGPITAWQIERKMWK